MIKEEEIEYYRQNITDRYVISVMTSLEFEERQNKIEYNRRKRINKLKHHPDYKQCKRCGEIKPLTEFYKNILKSKGVFDYCKECAKKREKQLREQRNANKTNTTKRPCINNRCK